MTTEQAAEIIKLLHSLDATGWIVIAAIGAIFGATIANLIRSK